MDNKQKLEELSGKITVIDNEIRQIYGDMNVNPQFEDFENANDQDKKEKFPELYAMQQRLENLENEKEPLILEQDELEQLIEQQEYINEGKKLYDEVTQEIEQHENDIATKSKQVPSELKKIQELNEQIFELKNTEEYQNGDEATLDKVKELESEMQSRILAKNKITLELKKLRAEINGLEKEKVKLIEKYGEEIIPAKQQPEQEQPVVEQHKTEQPKREDVATEKNEKKTEEDTVKTKKEKKQTKKENHVNPAQNVTENAQNYAAYNTVAYQQPKAQEKNEKSEQPKVDFKALCAKCKKGTLTDKEFAELAKIMQDPSNYDKYGITTGIIFNKSKSILKSMAKMVADTNTLSKEARIKLGIAVEQASEDNGLMSRYDLMEWKNLKVLLDNPDKKIAAEEQFKKVVAMERNTLTDEEKEVWDKAQVHLTKYEALRGALSTYGTVSNNRAEKAKSWFGHSKKENRPVLSASIEQPTAPTDKGILETLHGKTNATIDENSIPPKVVTTNDKNLTK